MYIVCMLKATIIYFYFYEPFSMNMLNDFKLSMIKDFDVTDMGELYYFLDIKVCQANEEIFICQEKYAKETLKKF